MPVMLRFSDLTCDSEVTNVACVTKVCQNVIKVCDRCDKCDVSVRSNKCVRCDKCDRISMCDRCDKCDKCDRSNKCVRCGISSKLKLSKLFKTRRMSKETQLSQTAGAQVSSNNWIKKIDKILGSKSEDI